MNPQIEYEMTQEQLDAIKTACKPVAYMMIGGTVPRSQQEKANGAWASLGKQMGFDGTTAMPSKKGARFFTAVPSETEPQKQERLRRVEEGRR